VALLIRENREDEATEEEREAHKKTVASGKKTLRTRNCNTWAIKSKEVQDEMLEFGSQKAHELTDLSTRDVFKNLKIDEGHASAFSELLLGVKKKPSGFLVKLKN